MTDARIAQAQAIATELMRTAKWNAQPNYDPNDCRDDYTVIDWLQDALDYLGHGFVLVKTEDAEAFGIVPRAG